MTSVEDEDELVEDRFDDQSFEDAPISDVESNFDEGELQSIDERGPIEHPAEELHCQNWSRPVLSTIPEESKIDDIQTSEISRRSPLGRDGSDGQSTISNDFSVTKAFSVRSSEFITDQKASEIIEREQDSFLRGHGRFIPDDPRFNQTHFDKENSWEPSVVDQSSFDTAAQGSPTSLPIPKSTTTELPTLSQAQASGGDCVEGNAENIEKALYRAVTPTNGDVEKDALTDLTNKRRNEDLDPLDNVRSTPDRVGIPSSTSLHQTPDRSAQSTIIAAQTSTPVSMVARLTSKTRQMNLAENFHGISMIKPEGDSPREGSIAANERSIAEVTSNSTIISVRKIQSILKSQPSSSSPRSLMRVLEEYKKDRVKARKARQLLPPAPPRKNSAPQPQPIEYQPATVNSGNTNTRLATQTRSGEYTTDGLAGDSNRATDIHKSVLTSSRPPAMPTPVFTAPVQIQPFSTAKERVAGEEMASRPGSVRSSSSLSTGVGARSSSQMSSVAPRKSVLYIPQLEVAFGFVALGDAAVSSVDVTNRTDNPLRIRAKLGHTGPPFTLLDSQIFVLDGQKSTSLRIEFCPTQNARYNTSLLIGVEGGGGPQVKYKMPVRGLGGAAVVTVKARDDLRLSRNGSYVLQSSYESTFSFTLINSGNRRAFARIVVFNTGESCVPEQVPADVRPSAGIVIDRVDSKQVSVRLQSPLSSLDWRSSQNSIVSTASMASQRAVSPLQVIVYWGEERTRQRLRCFEKKTGVPHPCEGILFTDTFVGEDATFCPPEDHPISKEDVRLFDQTLRMCTIYVCSPRIRPRSSLTADSSSSLERSLQPEDTFREKSTYRVVIPDQTLIRR